MTLISNVYSSGHFWNFFLYCNGFGEMKFFIFYSSNINYLFLVTDNGDDVIYFVISLLFTTVNLLSM